MIIGRRTRARQHPTKDSANALTVTSLSDKNKLVDESSDVSRDIGQLSQETIDAKVEDTPVHEVEERKLKRKKKQSKRNKEKRKERLLKFHLKLVNSSGVTFNSGGLASG